MFYPRFYLIYANSNFKNASNAAVCLWMAKNNLPRESFVWNRLFTYEDQCWEQFYSISAKEFPWERCNKQRDNIVWHVKMSKVEPDLLRLSNVQQPDWRNSMQAQGYPLFRVHCHPSAIWQECLELRPH